jgi:uncharacterized OB-fold protein
VTDSAEYGDPLTQAFWSAARRHELMVQRCAKCGSHQFYPRPMCLRCDSLDLAWVPVKGDGEVYSMTIVHLPVLPELTPPYVVAVVRLDEGPRITTNIEGGPVAIGDRVRLSWRDRDGLPALPIFRPAGP